MEALKDIFEGGFKFETSEARENFDRTASADRGAIWEQLGSERGVSDRSIAGDLG